MAISTVSPEDIIASELWNSVAGLLNGTTGFGSPVVLTRHNSASVYGLHVNNVDTTNGLAAKFTYGDPDGTPTNLLNIAKAAITADAPLLASSVSSNILALGNVAGQQVKIIQSGWNTTATHALHVAKLARATDGSNLTGGAGSEVSNYVSDVTTAGADPVAGKFQINSLGSGRTSSRAIEAISIRSVQAANTVAGAAYGAIAAGTMDIGSTRGIDVAISIDTNITAGYTLAIEAVGVNIVNRASGDNGGYTWNAKQGAAAIYVGGDTTSTTIGGNFQYFAIWDQTPTGVLAGPPSTRLLHIARAGGVDMLYLNSANTVATGVTLANTDSSGASNSIFTGGSGTTLPGGLVFWNHKSSAQRYMGAFWNSTVTTTIDQLLVQSGSATVPTYSFLDDLDTGLFRQAANSLGLVTAGTEAVRITSAQLVDFRVGAITNGGGAAPTLGTIGGSGPAAAAQFGWQKIEQAGTATYVPVWR